MTASAADPRCPARRYASVAAALAGCFLASYYTRVIGVGLPDLRGAFGLSIDEASWLATTANAPQILVAPAVPWMAMVFGIRPILMGPGLAYAALVAAIPFVRDPLALFALHGATGLLLGLFVPATLLVIVRNLPPQLWLWGFAAYAFRLAFTLNTGPALTGWLVADAGWEWLYLADVPLALTMVALAWAGPVSEAPDRKLLARADWGGMCLFGGGLTLIYVGLDQGNRLDWDESGLVTALIAGGLALMAAFVVQETVTPNPWAAPRILLSRNTLLGIATGVVFSAVAVSNSVVVPNFLVVVAGLRPEQFGPFLALYVALPLVVTCGLGAVLLRRVDFRFVMMAGFAAFAAASLLGMQLTGAWRMADFALLALFQSVGLGITFTAVMVGNFTSIRPEVAVAFAAYIQILRLVGVEFGVVVMMTFLRVREQLHSNLLGLHLDRNDLAVAAALAERTAGFRASDAATALPRALLALGGEVRREANVLASIDAFALTFVLALAGILVAGLMRRAPAGPLTGGR